MSSTFFTSLTVRTVPAPTNKSLFFNSRSIILSAPGVVRVISITLTPAATNASAITWPSFWELALTKVIIFCESNLSMVFTNYSSSFVKYLYQLHQQSQLVCRSNPQTYLQLRLRRYCPVLMHQVHSSHLVGQLSSHQ